MAGTAGHASPGGLARRSSWGGAPLPFLGPYIGAAVAMASPWPPMSRGTMVPRNQSLMGLPTTGNHGLSWIKLSQGPRKRSDLALDGPSRKLARRIQAPSTSHRPGDQVPRAIID